MKKAKFAPGDSVIYKGSQYEISVSNKVFATNSFYYTLKGVSEKVDESELTEGKSVKSSTEDLNLLQPLYERYSALYSKSVPSNKRKDLDWIKTKIKEKEDELEKNSDDENPMTLPVLRSFTHEELISYCEESGIDPADYNDDEELIQAVCEEMDIPYEPLKQ